MDRQLTTAFFRRSQFQTQITGLFLTVYGRAFGRRSRFVLVFKPDASEYQTPIYDSSSCSMEKKPQCCDHGTQCKLITTYIISLFLLKKWSYKSSIDLRACFSFLEWVGAN